MNLKKNQHITEQWIDIFEEMICIVTRFEYEECIVVVYLHNM
jgi:hypothetical protein